MKGYHHHRDIASLLVQGLQDLHARQLRHLQVQDNQIWLLSQSLRQAFLSVHGGQRLVTVGFQDVVHEKIDNALGIVNDQHSFTSHHLLLPWLTNQLAHIAGR